MSKISDLFDELKSRIESALPTHKQLTNPYFPEQNTENVLEKGYGILFLPGENSERNISCKLSVRRTMGITLTRKRLATEFEAEKKETAEKNLMEDQQLLINTFESNPVLGTSISFVKWASDGGIVNVMPDRDNFIKLEGLYQVEYFENL